MVGGGEYVLSLINMDSLECIQGPPVDTLYKRMQQAAADNYISLILYILLVALVQTMVGSGKNPEKLKNDHLSIYITIYSVYIKPCVQWVSN